MGKVPGVEGIRERTNLHSADVNVQVEPSVRNEWIFAKPHISRQGSSLQYVKVDAEQDTQCAPSRRSNFAAARGVPRSYR